jgi:PAS domain S-box-containing protein
VVARDGGLVLDANEALLALLDVKDAELIGQPLARLEQHLDHGTLAGVAARFDAEGQLQAAPLRLRRRDGDVRDCLLGVTALQVDGGTQLLCMLRDVTEALRNDAALRRDFDAMRQALLDDAHAERQRADSAVEVRAQAEQALRDFTRAVSHDLRTPLIAVHGFAGLLRLHLRAGRIPQAIAASEQIEAAAQRMTAMIGALTRLAQTDRQPLQRATVDMARLARDTWALLQAAHPERRVDGRIDTLPTAQADADLVAQVWQNLLDNAWKFSREAADARVRVDSLVDAGRTWYRVADNGAGFDSAKAQRLFMPFQRFHGTARFGGTGIGLSLVRRIVEHHGGEVRLRSAEGVGTVVEFCLEPPAMGEKAAG